MIHLILQVLGNSDILVDGDEGAQTLNNVYCLEDIKQKVDWNNEDLINNLNRVDFPLIKQLYESQKILLPDTEFLFGIILTDQVKWMQKRSESGEGWNGTVRLDGCWWDKILSAWCEQQNIQFYPVYLDVAPEVTNGAADWEGMAETMQPLLNGVIQFEDKSIYFQPLNREKIKIDKITLQHSSGTPALSSALYLWGIEQKLAGINIDFAYISEQEPDCLPHSGNHWQWRLKVPQIWELIKIQDFSGALKLLEGHPQQYQSLVDSLSFLDKSVSLNIIERNLSARDDVIERISIALWSEKAFRDRSQWMHWYLRMAGAFELALFLLLEKQGNGIYQWQERNLIFDYNGQSEILKIGIAKIVCELLKDGKSKQKKQENNKDISISLTASKITDAAWRDFYIFYLTNWDLEPGIDIGGFTNLRNELYHSLRGDIIDDLLDKKTKQLNNQVTHPEHPSQIAVEWLKYIIKLADISPEVNAKTEAYRQKVQEIMDNL